MAKQDMKQRTPSVAQIGIAAIVLALAAGLAFQSQPGQLPAADTGSELFDNGILGSAKQVQKSQQTGQVVDPSLVDAAVDPAFLQGQPRIVTQNYATSVRADGRSITANEKDLQSARPGSPGMSNDVLPQNIRVTKRGNKERGFSVPVMAPAP